MSHGPAWHRECGLAWQGVADDQMLLHQAFHCKFPESVAFSLVGLSLCFHVQALPVQAVTAEPACILSPAIGAFRSLLVAESCRLSRPSVC